MAFFERCADFAKPRSSGLFWHCRNLLKKVRTERVLSLANVTLRFSHQLRYEMHVADSAKKISKRTKVPIYVYLLDIALTEALDISSVFGIWPRENSLTLFLN